MAEDFYLTLPSNSSMYWYPNNTQSNFNTALLTPIKLDSCKHEVALTEIILTPSYDTSFGYLKVKNPFYIDYLPLRRKQFIYIDLYYSNDNKPINTLLNINSNIKSQIVKEEYEYRQREFYEADVNLINEIAEYNTKVYRNNINKKRVQVLDYIAIRTNHFTQDVIYFINNNNIKYNIFSVGGLNQNYVESQASDNISYVLSPPGKFFSSEIDSPVVHIMAPDQDKFIDESDQMYKEISNFIDKKLPLIKFEVSNKLLIVESLQNCEIGGYLAQLLNSLNFNSKNNTLSISSNNVYKFKIIENFRMLNFACIYTDIIENQYFGDSFVPILRIINLLPSDKSKILTFYDNPHYIPLNKTILSTINIKICDLMGNQIKFNDIFSFVFLKLHIRKIKNE